MARYFLHIWDGNRRIADIEGQEFSIFEEARQEAVENARDLFAERLRSGKDVKEYAIELADEAGTVVARIDLQNFSK
jgi:uncharacterized protein YoaH (UPF0181 family)